MIAKPPVDPEARCGACPRCLSADTYITVGSAYFLMCSTHSVYWPAGEDLPWPRGPFDILDQIDSLKTLAAMQPVLPVFLLPVRPVPIVKQAAA